MENTAPSAELNSLAEAHMTFVSPEELGADAAAEAPATTPTCFWGGVTIGAATVSAGC